MRKKTAVHVAGVRGFFRGIKRSVVAAAVLLAWDGALSGSYVMSVLVCPIWFLVSLLKNAIERPGWGLALVSPHLRKIYNFETRSWSYLD